MIFSLSLFGLLAAAALTHLLLTLRLRARIRRPSAVPTNPWQPQVAVVLSVRGYDSFLDRCVQGLIDQDYAHYTVHIVVDSEHDPAWQAVSKHLASGSAEHVRVTHLRKPRSTCSLKCSALVQALEELKADCEVVAFIDADVIPHRTWLSELVSPLADERVGIVTGNRWYLPGIQRLGTAVRCVWNASAVMQMYNFGSNCLFSRRGNEMAVAGEWEIPQLG